MSESNTNTVNQPGNGGGQLNSGGNGDRNGLKKAIYIS